MNNQLLESGTENVLKMEREGEPEQNLKGRGLIIFSQNSAVM